MVHLPLGLLSMGVMMEVFCLIFCRKSSMKIGARWMILLGALMSVPALTTGIYAYRDVMVSDTRGDEPFGETWIDTKEGMMVVRSPITVAGTSESKNTEYKVGDKISVADFINSAPGKALYDHLIYNCIAVGALFFAIITYLASSNRWRKNLYFPILLILIASKGLMIYGSHHGGLAVYQYGAAIEPATIKTTKTGVSAGKLALQENAKQYLPPAQMHVAAAGMILSFALLAFALSIRNITKGESDGSEEWYQSNPATGGSKPLGKPAPSAGSATSSFANPAPAFTPHLHATSSHGHGTIPVTASSYPAAAQAKNAPHSHDTAATGVSRYWLFTALFTVATIVSGLWMVNKWALHDIKELLRSEKEVRDKYHAILGGAMLALALLLALTSKVFKSKALTSLISLVLVAVIAAQFYVGIVLMFDGPSANPGSQGIRNVLKFNVPDAKSKDKDKD